jgi:hypothetical protein
VTEAGARDVLDAFDQTVDLGMLLSAEELDELARGFATAHGVQVAVEDRAGVRLAGPAGVDGVRRSFHLAGEPVGVVIASGERAEAVAAHFADVLGLVLHHAQARHLTSARTRRRSRPRTTSSTPRTAG